MTTVSVFMMMERRVDDMVVTPEGVTVGPAALSLAFQSVPNLREAQIVQDSADRIELALAVTPAYGPADEQFLVAELRKRDPADAGTFTANETTFVTSLNARMISPPPDSATVPYLQSRSAFGGSAPSSRSRKVPPPVAVIRAKKQPATMS